jgi:hypothetical protein
LDGDLPSGLVAGHSIIIALVLCATSGILSNFVAPKLLERGII